MPQKRDGQKDEVAQALAGIGLDTNESAVYRALLALGQVGAAAIARETGLHGQIVYRTLERLEQSGLVNRTLINNRSRFRAHSPKRLLTQIDERRARLEDAVRILEAGNTPPLQDEIQVFQGKSEFVAKEFELISTMPKNSTLYVITGVVNKWEETLGDRLIEYDYIKSKRNIEMKLICPEEQGKIYATTDRPLISYRTLPQQFHGDINIGIYGDIFGMYMFTEPVSSVVIHNKAIAQSYKNFFDALWKMGK